MEDKEDPKEMFRRRIRMPGIGCSNTIAYHPSSPDLRCNYINNGLCAGYLSCPVYHPSIEFQTLGELEVNIRELLLLARPYSLLVRDLPNRYYWWHKKHMPIDESFKKQCDWMVQWNGMIQCSGMLHDLSILHTVLTLPDRCGNSCIALLEDFGPSKYDCDGNGADKIYLTFAPISRITKRDVWNYFCHYGVVIDVQIPVVKKCRMFGFVTFLHRETVNLLLSQRDPKVPHNICGVAVFAKRFKPKWERIPNEGRNVIQSRHASDVPKEETVHGDNGENEQCPHLLCEIITSTGARKICAECQKLLSQIMELVKREKCSDCGKLLNQIIESVRKSKNCARCRQLLREIILFSQQHG